MKTLYLLFFKPSIFFAELRDGQHMKFAQLMLAYIIYDKFSAALKLLTKGSKFTPQFIGGMFYSMLGGLVLIFLTPLVLKYLGRMAEKAYSYKQWLWFVSSTEAVMLLGVILQIGLLAYGINSGVKSADELVNMSMQYNWALVVFQALYMVVGLQVWLGVSSVRALVMACVAFAIPIMAAPFIILGLLRGVLAVL